MKILKVVVAFLFLPGIMKPFSDDTTGKPHYIIEISASMHVRGTPADNYEIQISRDGKILDSASVKKAKSVFFELEQDHIYTFIFKKSGYDEKMVMIDTHVHVKDKKLKFFSFEFDVEMDHGVSTLKREYHDYPVAWIKFDKRHREFEVVGKYHKEVHITHSEKTFSD